MPERSPARTALRRAQSLHLRAGRGMTIVAATGAVRVEYAFTWLGEQVMQEKSSLQEGEAHVVRKSGWLALSTPADRATVCIVPPASLITSLLASVARLALRRHVRHAEPGLHDAA